MSTTRRRIALACLAILYASTLYALTDIRFDQQHGARMLHAVNALLALAVDWPVQLPEASR